MIQDGQCSEGMAIGDERNADRGTLDEEVRATWGGASAGMRMGATAPKSPTLFGREDPIGGTDSPFGGGLEAVFRGGEQRDGGGGAWEKTAAALRDQAEDFFPGSGGPEEASEVAHLGKFGSFGGGSVRRER